MKLEIKDKELIINDEYCYLCESEEKITKHHTIPVYLKPKNNVLIPLCRECHTKVHSQDMNNIQAYMHKLKCCLEYVGNGFRHVGNMFKKTQREVEETNILDHIKKRGEK